MEETERNYLQIAAWGSRPAPVRKPLVDACVEIKPLPASPEAFATYEDVMQRYERAIIDRVAWLLGPAKPTNRSARRCMRCRSPSR